MRNEHTWYVNRDGGQDVRYVQFDGRQWSTNATFEELCRRIVRLATGVESAKEGWRSRQTQAPRDSMSFTHELEPDYEGLRRTWERPYADQEAKSPESKPPTPDPVRGSISSIRADIGLLRIITQSLGQQIEAVRLENVLLTRRIEKLEFPVRG